jgi:DNA-binding CsgD family transcriptional regulator
MSVRESEEFTAKVLAALDDLYQGQFPELPPWFPVDIFDELPPASSLLVAMVAADLYARGVPWPLQHVGLSLTFLWIGLNTTVEARVGEDGEKPVETNDEERIDMALNDLLGTSGRGMLAKRMRSLGLDRSREITDRGKRIGYSSVTDMARRVPPESVGKDLQLPELADVHSELQDICIELLHQLASRQAEKGINLRDPERAGGYFRNAFKKRLEKRLDALIGKRKDAMWGSGQLYRTEPRGEGNPTPRVDVRTDVTDPDESDFAPEDRLDAQSAMDKTDNLSPQEKKVFLLTYRDGLKGKARGKALGTTPETARVHLKNALDKIKKHLPKDTT